jgi:endonuclease/exonuclease/phosphatase family metal-dependent hydrolase
MKHFTAIVFILFISGLHNLSAQSGTGKLKLVVMTYNIHHANPPSVKDKIDIDAIAKVINQQKPDLVALQEVDVYTQRSGKEINEAEALANKTGMQFYFAKAIDFEGGEYGVAILSKFPLENSATHKLPTAEGIEGEPRVIATSFVQLPGGRKILFACTHFDAEDNDTSRFLQVNKIAEILNEQALPVIIGGDFNAEPGTRVINKLDSFITRTCKQNCGSSFPDEGSSRLIDFIGYSPSKAFSVKRYQVIDEKYASDHVPVISVIELR